MENVAIRYDWGCDRVDLGFSKVSLWVVGLGLLVSPYIDTQSSARLMASVFNLRWRRQYVYA